MPKKYIRWVSAYLSCTHGGHELGLLNPNTWFPEYHLTENGPELIDKVRAILNPTQETLWGLYNSHIDEAYYIAGKDQIGFTHLGDAAQGDKYLDGLVFTEEGQQTILAVNNWEPVFAKKKKPSFIRYVWGTPSHRFNSNSMPMIIHRNLKENYPGTDIKTYRHGLMTLNRIKTDVAHQGNGPGIRNWTEGNVFELYCKSIMMDDIDDGKEPPALIVRSHYHTKVERWPIRWKGTKRYKTCGILVPSYQMMTNYAHRVTKSASKLVIGMALVEIINGRIHDVHWLIDEFDLRIEEVIA